MKVEHYPSSPLPFFFFFFPWSPPRYLGSIHTDVFLKHHTVIFVFSSGSLLSRRWEMPVPLFITGDCFDHLKGKNDILEKEVRAPLNSSMKDNRKF